MGCVLISSTVIKIIIIINNIKSIIIITIGANVGEDVGEGIGDGFGDGVSDGIRLPLSASVGLTMKPRKPLLGDWSGHCKI